MIYTLDIETEPNEKLVDIFVQNIKAPSNYKDEDKIKAYIDGKRLEQRKKMATDPHFCTIKFIGIKELGKEGAIVDLQTLAGLLENDSQPKFITFNGKSFDFPTLVLSGLAQGIELPFVEFMLATRKFNKFNHVDMQEVMLFGGPPQKGRSLEFFVELYLGRSKAPIDHETCTIEECEEHCLEDLQDTEDLFIKFKPICQFGG